MIGGFRICSNQPETFPGMRPTRERMGDGSMAYSSEIAAETYWDVELCKPHLMCTRAHNCFYLSPG